ncbi:alpha/beta hydrolase [Novosphingobium resinovorum]|uniref:alpha/beta fold hydrolase n=1 Tax=Novosphingobium resinovorum TaxID=158500 RepID=UPI002ED26F95|nr:alpha/beta hydrolase [Novosphingobium resinovorum]
MQIVRSYAKGRWGQVHLRSAGSSGGEKLPLVCIHSTPSSGAMWDAILPRLGRDRLVIAPDTPGYGMSDPPPAPVSIRDHAQALAVLCDELGLGGIDLAGFHTGSIIATELANLRPDLVRRVVVFGLAAYDAEARAKRLAGVRTVFPEPAADLVHIEKLWAKLTELADPRLQPEERHVAMADTLRTGSRLPWGFMAVYGHDFIAAMGQVAQPVLVMNPEDDLWLPTRAHWQAYPDARLVEIPGVKHGVLKLETDRVEAEMRAFLDMEPTCC